MSATHANEFLDNNQLHNQKLRIHVFSSCSAEEKLSRGLGLRTENSSCVSAGDSPAAKEPAS